MPHTIYLKKKKRELERERESILATNEALIAENKTLREDLAKHNKAKIPARKKPLSKRKR